MSEQVQVQVEDLPGRGASGRGRGGPRTASLERWLSPPVKLSLLPPRAKVNRLRAETRTAYVWNVEVTHRGEAGHCAVASCHALPHPGLVELRHDGSVRGISAPTSHVPTAGIQRG